MNYCASCCQPDTRPQIIFKDGICGACLWEEEKKKIDWRGRELHLKEIAEVAQDKARQRGTYDCALGVSGGKDSLFTALYAKLKLHLNCLLVSAAPDQITEVGQRNFDNLVNHGFDCIRIFVNPDVAKRLMREEFIKYCHFRKANEFPLWASVYTVAKEKNIPLIIQGENAALTLGASKNMNIDWDASTIYKTNTLGGEDAIKHFSYAFPNQLFLFKYPDLSDWDGKAIWLNYFVKEWSQHGNAQFSMARGLQIRDDSLDAIGRIHKWTSLDSDFHIVSQMHKYFKYSFGFATDEVCYDMRENRLSREEGFELIKKYDGKCDRKYIQKFCDFIGIPEEEHWRILKRFVKYDPWNRWQEMSII